jgi:putative transposase
MSNEHPHRKHPTHGIYYAQYQSTIIFGTVCTKNRMRWLACDEVHEILRDVWMASTAWLMGKYMILPDHIHFFAESCESKIEYDKWVTYWKSQFSKRYQQPAHRWQSDHWDTRIRSATIYDEKWEYIRWNPHRHGLVEHPDQWPFQGQIHKLRWE